MMRFSGPLALLAILGLNAPAWAADPACGGKAITRLWTEKVYVDEEYELMGRALRYVAPQMLADGAALRLIGRSADAIDRDKQEPVPQATGAPAMLDYYARNDYPIALPADLCLDRPLDLLPARGGRKRQGETRWSVSRPGFSRDKKSAFISLAMEQDGRKTAVGLWLKLQNGVWRVLAQAPQTLEP